MGVGGDDFLIDHVCHLDRDVFLGVEHAGQPVMLAGRKQLRAGAGDAPNPIQWVAGMAAPAEGLLLDALADFLRRRVELRRNAVKVGGEFVVGSLKNHKNRSVALPAFVMDELARTCEGKDRDELLWPSPRGGYISGPSLWKTSWLAMAVGRCRKADPTFPRVTPHDLRHTAASLAISAGANPKVVQRMLGHASAAMTLDVYADLFESDLDSVAESVAKMWPRLAN